MLALPAIGKTAKGENRLLSVSEPRTLYKYMTPQRALNCIPEVGDGTLRATQPAALNDPFECAVATAYVFEDEAEEDRELAKVLTEINENKPISAIEVLTARIEYGSLFTRQLLSDQISTRFGIVSFTANPHHPLMWSLYTTDGSGFVIGYDILLGRGDPGRGEDAGLRGGVLGGHEPRRGLRRAPGDKPVFGRGLRGTGSPLNCSEGFPQEMVSSAPNRDGNAVACER